MKLRMISLLGLTSLAFACGADDGEKIETTQVHAIVAQNTGDTITAAITNANFLEQSDLIARILETGISSDCVVPGEAAVPVESGVPIDTNTIPDCDSPMDFALNLDDFQLQEADISNFLQQTVFQPGNIETSTETQITYLVSGESVCGQEDSMFPSDCIADVNAAKLRLVVTSPAQNEVDIDVLVGPDRDNPLSLEFHHNLLALEVDLDGIGGAASYIDSQGLLELGGSDFPTTFQGRLRAEVKVEGPQKISGALSIVRALNVAGGDYGVKIDATSPTYKVTLDGVNETLSILADLGKADFEFPLNEQQWEVHLGGLNGEALFSAANDTIALSGLGYGNETSTLTIDGQQAIAFDINPATGRHFDLLASPSVNGVKLDFTDALEVIVAMNFTNIPVYANEFVDNDTFKLSLEGNSPSLKIEEGIVEVLDGTLKMSLENAGNALEANAGQCVSPLVTASSSEAPTPDRPELNPIESLVVGACE